MVPVLIVVGMVTLAFLAIIVTSRYESKCEQKRMEDRMKERERLRNHPLFLNRESIAQARYQHRCKDGIPGDSNEDWHIAGQVIEKRFKYLKTGYKEDGFEVYHWCYPTNHKPEPQVDEWYEGKGYQVTGAISGFFGPNVIYTRVK